MKTKELSQKESMLNPLTREHAIELAKSNWWKNCTDREIVIWSLGQPRLCLPFDVFHEKLEAVLGRPVMSHEIALDFDNIVNEVLRKGDR